MNDEIVNYKITAHDEKLKEIYISDIYIVSHSSYHLDYNNSFNIIKDIYLLVNLNTTNPILPIICLNNDDAILIITM